MSTITTVDRYQEISIYDLKEQFRAENSKARNAAKKSLEHVRNCGDMLISMKARVPHGQWKLVSSGLNLSTKTISNYMSIARNWQRVADLNYGVKDALQLLCREDTPPSPAPVAPRPSPATVIIEAEIAESSPAPQDAEPLTADESARLGELEAIIENGKESLEEVSNALAEIGDIEKSKGGDESQEAFAEIVSLLSKLSNDQLIELRKIITSRWT